MAMEELKHHFSPSSSLNPSKITVRVFNILKFCCNVEKKTLAKCSGHPNESIEH